LLWNFYKTKEENLSYFWEQSKDALRSISIKSHELFGCGMARGGRNPVGGPCWLDFWMEFSDDINIPPQIVGHTQDSNTVKQSGRSYCIDGAQTTYIILKDTGEFEIKTTNNAEGKWNYQNVKFPQSTRSLD
jgi:hypothetical protein